MVKRRRKKYRRERELTLLDLYKRRKRYAKTAKQYAQTGHQIFVGGQRVGSAIHGGLKEFFKKKSIYAEKKEFGFKLRNPFKKKGLYD